jgi:hypothetical protein
MKPVTCGAPRIGRNTARDRDPGERADRDHEQEDQRPGDARGDQAEGGEGTEHHQVAVGEIDQPDDAVDHRKTDRDQGVEAAQHDPVDQLLDVVAAHFAPPAAWALPARPR